MIQQLPYRMFVLSQRSDRPNEPWTIEAVIEPGPIDLGKMLHDTIMTGVGRPYPLNWSWAHEEVRVLNGATQFICHRRNYEAQLDHMAVNLAQIAAVLADTVKAIQALRSA